MREVNLERARALTTAKTRKSFGIGVSSVLGCLFCLALTIASPVYAQKSSGQITGTILDQTGAALPDTTVNVTQIETGLNREVKSNQDGNFTVPDQSVYIAYPPHIAGSKKQSWTV